MVGPVIHGGGVGETIVMHVGKLGTIGPVRGPTVFRRKAFPHVSQFVLPGHGGGLKYF